MTHHCALTAYLTACRHKRFRPGRFECALFAADWVLIVSGTDLAARWRGKYASIEDGRDLIAEAGYDNPVAIAAEALKEVSGWMQAEIGDIAVVEEAGEACFGIIGGAHIHVLRVQRGLDVVPLARAARVFRP